VTLKFCSDMSAADWIVQAQIPWKQLVYFGPPDFPAYARLRFIPDLTRPGQEEADANVAEDDPSDIKQTRRAFLHLRRFTATPENCYFCVWEGYSGLNVPPLGAAWAHGDHPPSEILSPPRIAVRPRQLA